jgi:ABC-2 type transport system permease protein
MKSLGRTLIRVWALMRKESRQLLRDRATFGMLLGIPILQIALFAGAIELAPHSLGIRIVTADPRKYEHAEHLLAASGNSVYLDRAPSRSSAMQALKRGQALMVIDIDALPPVVFLDATNPVLATQAELMLERVVRSISGPVEAETEAPVFLINRLYNADLRTQPFMVTGLVGVILTMSLVMMSALTIARERERGTLEGLLSAQVTVLELWMGKLAPYVLLGLIQATLVLLIARFAFHIEPSGSLWSLAIGTLVFSVANVALGFLFSCVARQQMQAMQMTFFFFLPSSLLSGFMFPFEAMPRWAQLLAEALPLTHYLRIVRGLVLRDVDGVFVLGETVPIMLFAAGVTLAALLVGRRAIA